MTCTRQEFSRSLGQAFGPALREDPGGLLLSLDGVDLYFALSSDPPRQLGALQLAALRVEISIRAGSERAAEVLLAKVDRPHRFSNRCAVHGGWRTSDFSG